MASASGSGSKETTQQADKSDILKLSISSQDGNKVYFKVKPDSPLRKVFRAFCTRKNFDYDSTKFIYDGVQLRETQTPKMLDMEDDDDIFAVRDQIGGKKTGTK